MRPLKTIQSANLPGYSITLRATYRSAIAFQNACLTSTAILAELLRKTNYVNHRKRQHRAFQNAHSAQNAQARDTRSQVQNIGFGYPQKGRLHRKPQTSLRAIVERPWQVTLFLM